MPAAKRTPRITEVWASNVEEEIETISQLIDDYNHVALDTEFPGVIMRLVANDHIEGNYQTIRQNVDVLKLIQLGLTLSNSDGSTDDNDNNNNNNNSDVSQTWQFNFAFSLTNDIYAQDSIDLLQRSGVDFNAHEKNGIDPIVFADLLTTSGLLCNDAIQWVTFHGGYDFAYFIKTLVGHRLPKTQSEFFRLLKVLFPKRYDLKCLIKTQQQHATSQTRTVTTNGDIQDDSSSTPLKNNNSNSVTPDSLTSSATMDNNSSSQHSPSKSTSAAATTNDHSKQKPLFGGLNRIAELVGCERTGSKHQAGSDSLLTLKVYFRIRDDVFHGEIDSSDDGRLYGLGIGGLIHG